MCHKTKDAHERRTKIAKIPGLGGILTSLP